MSLKLFSCFLSKITGLVLLPVHNKLAIVTCCIKFKLIHRSVQSTVVHACEFVYLIVNTVSYHLDLLIVIFVIIRAKFQKIRNKCVKCYVQKGFLKIATKERIIKHQLRCWHAGFFQAVLWGCCFLTQLLPQQVKRWFWLQLQPSVFKTSKSKDFYVIFH